MSALSDPLGFGLGSITRKKSTPKNPSPLNPPFRRRTIYRVVYVRNGLTQKQDFTDPNRAALFQANIKKVEGVTRVSQVYQV